MKKQFNVMMICMCFFFVLIYSVEAEQVGLIPVPVFKDVKVQSLATYDPTSGLYTYSYTIVNPSRNTGKIRSIYIDISQPPDGVILSSAGLTIPFGVETKTFDEVISIGAEFLPKPISVVPVGIRVPIGWDGDLAPTFSSGDSLTTGSDNIEPGETQSGFEVISRGLPTIRRIELKPKWVLMVDSEEDVTPEMKKQAREIKASLIYRTKTIGPTAPPADFKATNFIDYIITMKHEAFSLGWITNEGIENSLDAKLENAKLKIEQGDINAAKNILTAFLNEVEAQGCKSYDNCPIGKHLTSEAYALLFYNVNYLIEQLK